VVRNNGVVAGDDFGALMRSADPALLVVTVAGHTGPDFAPLRQSAVGHLHPGHGPAERPGPPSERAAPGDLDR
jgi:hypothetical protein